MQNELNLKTTNKDKLFQTKYTKKQEQRRKKKKERKISFIVCVDIEQFYSFEHIISKFLEFNVKNAQEIKQANDHASGNIFHEHFILCFVGGSVKLNFYSFLSFFFIRW